MIISYLENFHEKSPMKGGVLKEPIRQYLQTNELVINVLLEELELEKKIQAISAKSHDHKEGINAFFEKRIPKYKGN